MLNKILMMIMFIILMLMILLSIAFFTLLERKILSYTQLRKGPNKNLFWGLFQPIFDGVKLFLKENSINNNNNKIMYNISPFLGLVLMLTFWLNFNFMYQNFLLHSLIFIIFISSINIYTILGSGWSSNSKYALIGTFRSSAQVISYEIGLMFFMLSFLMQVNNFNLFILNLKSNMSHMLFWGMIFYFLSWMTIILAELNRSPFDFAESESELVSGFNIEYGSMKFAFLFLSEYGNMIFMSYLTLMLFFNSFYLIMILLMMFLVWIRTTFPRFRYDFLMYLNWKIFLPQILFLFLIMFMFWNM